MDGRTIRAHWFVLQRCVRRTKIAGRSVPKLWSGARSDLRKAERLIPAEVWEPALRLSFEMTRGAVAYNLDRKLESVEAGDRILQAIEQIEVDDQDEEHAELLSEASMIGGLCLLNSLEIEARVLAIAQLERCIRIDRERVDALNAVAWELVTNPKPEIRNVESALSYATRARS